MDKLDNFIKGKLADEAIVFNENHWMEASRLIEAKEQEKRRRIAFWLFMGQLFGVLLLLFFVLWGAMSPITIPLAEKQVSKNKIQAENKRKETNTQTQAGKIEKKQQTQNGELTNKQNQQIASNKKKPQAKKIKSIITKSGKINNNQHKSITKKEKEIDKALPSKALTKKESKASLPIIVIPNSIVMDTPSVQEETVLAIIKPQKRYGIAEYIPVNLTLLALDVKAQVNEMPVPKVNPTRLQYRWSAYAASTLYPYSQVGSKGLIGYVAGFNFELKFNKKWSMETGARYRIRKGSFITSQKSEQISYAFGKSSTTHSLLPKSIHTLEIPLVVSFTERKHKISLGINYARLVGAQGSLNKTDNDNETPITEKVASGWIADNSFKKNTYAALIGYSFAVTPVFRLNAELHYTYGGILNDGNTANFYIESKPIFIDFGIRYNLINR